MGTYATIKVNGHDFGRHPVGRTTLTLDVTDALKQGTNRLEVKAEHPEMIADMPWLSAVRNIPSGSAGGNR